MEKRYSCSDGGEHEEHEEHEEHTRRKHKILREYFARYLEVRCVRPQQTKFRLAVIEGFAGGGRYKCGTAGSPIIFPEELRSAVERFNIKRQAASMAPLEIECFLVLNDDNPDAVRVLKGHVGPLVAATRAEVPKLHLQVRYFEKPFDVLYPEVKELLGVAYFRASARVDRRHNPCHVVLAEGKPQCRCARPTLPRIIGRDNSTTFRPIAPTCASMRIIVNAWLARNCRPGRPAQRQRPGNGEGTLAPVSD